MDSIGSFTGTNVPGNCWMQYVDVAGIATFPTEVAGNLEDSITLSGGYAWTRIAPMRFSMAMAEDWTTTANGMVPRARLVLSLQKDDLNKLPGLWSHQLLRTVILVRTRNGDTLCMGTKAEGCRFTIAKRTTGAAPSDEAGYDLTWSVARRTPVPFYQGSVPTPGGGSSGSLVTVDGIDITGPTYDEAVMTIL